MHRETEQVLHRATKHGRGTMPTAPGILPEALRSAATRGSECQVPLHMAPRDRCRTRPRLRLHRDEARERFSMTRSTEPRGVRCAAPALSAGILVRA